MRRKAALRDQLRKSEVVDQKKDPKHSSEVGPSAGDFWQRVSLQELARQQGVQPVERFEDLLGGWPEDQIDDGFEEALERWRQESLLSEQIPDRSPETGK